MNKVLVIIILSILLSCKNSKTRYNMDNEALISFLYDNIDSVDFEEHREEMILLDLDYNHLIDDIKIKYQSDNQLETKLEKIEQSRSKFYEYAIKIVRQDYEKYHYVDGPYFEYLVDKKDKEVQNVMLKIISDSTISQDLKKEILQKLNKQNIFKIQDPDGYTNLRRGKGTSTEIIQQIKSGESVEILDNSGEWYLVKTKEGKEGYVHKSRVKLNISKPISMSLYSRPDWNSFFQDIRVEEEVKYIHKVSGWDHVKIGDQLGYFPPIGEDKPVKKHSFLVEENLYQRKKKAFGISYLELYHNKTAELLFSRFPLYFCSYSVSHWFPSSPLCPSILIKKFFAGK